MTGSRSDRASSAGGLRQTRRRRSLSELPRFDPNPSLEAGARILSAAGAPFALAGRVAVWMYVPPGGQVFTKDVDFAVPYGYAEAIEKAAREAGYSPSRLAVGGVRIRKGEVAVDFVDGHPHVAAIFADAVKAADREGERGLAGETEIPTVPKRYLIVMKLVPYKEGIERDVQELLKTITAKEYREVRCLVEKYFGYIWTQQLDRTARELGHRGVEPRYG